MKNILLIGVGGTGSKAVDIFFQKCNEMGIQSGNNITALVFDTDAGDLRRIKSAKTVVMADTASVGTICDRFGHEYLKEWFPCDNKAVRAQEMIKGASQWRKKSYLAFLNLMNKPRERNTFISALEQMTLDPSSICEVYIIASVAGGTGSGSFIPIALYAKRYLRKNLGKDPIVNAMIALPDIYADSQTSENRIKVYSNAYAILRELNAINLVARNYNAGLHEHKKAPIRFRIGDAREPNVGVLFDASDKQFWTPEAAPFSQVFLLDRIPGLNSVSAHDMVLANSLYTMLCTDIGAAFDSEFSNHELLRSQNNGSNAIYAGISTAQIRFPAESVLDYLAYKKTVDSCDNEWLILHKATECAIKEKEMQAKARRQRYTMRDDDYAALVINNLQDLEESNNDEIISLLERCVYSYDKEGNKVEGALSSYVDNIEEKLIDAKIPSPDDIIDEFKSICSDNIPKTGKVDPANVTSNAMEFGDSILRYYKQCIDSIKGTANSTADAILSLDRKKEGFIGKDYAVVENVLKRNEKFIHPVAAMIQLCNLRKEIQSRIESNKTEEWTDIKRRNINDVPDNLLDVSNNRKRGTKSDYAKQDGSRFASIISEGDAYYGDIAHKDVRGDMLVIQSDAESVVSRIYGESLQQLRFKVYSAVASNLDLLISKYRSFFNRFEKEKEDLIEQTKTAYRKDVGNIDSVINVYSSQKDKDAIYKDIVEDGGPVTDEELRSADNIAGAGVYNTAYNAAASEFAKDNSWNEKNSSVYRSLFGDMVSSYRKSIKKSEEFDRIASFNAVEAIVATCGRNPDPKDLDDAFKNCFAVAQELATPSLRLDANENSGDLVHPSDILVFMMSVNTGRYIKKHADDFGLPLPADQNNEKEVIRACAEEFIRRFSGNTSARVSIVSSMPDNVLYCTGEIMDITPLRIAKFDELGEDNTYFKNYSKALENFNNYKTDMWNPHLGNDLHKRGYLPYMNPDKELECDKNVAKALVFGMFKGFITYKDSMGDGKGKYYFYHDGKKITDTDNKWINKKNVAQLMSWLRNEDELVEKWSKMYDNEVKLLMNSLPSLASDSPNEIANLEKCLSNSSFMKILTDKLYNDDSIKELKSTSRRAKIKGGKVVDAEREGPTVIEFAYMIKTSEELGRDCDDAERVLAVVYETFKALCDYRTNANNNPERFIQVYRQQLGNVYETLASASIVYSAGSECLAYFNQLVTWLNKSDVFHTISLDSPMDEQGNVSISALYEYNKSSDSTKKVLKYILSGGKDDGSEEGERLSSAESEVEAEAEPTEGEEQVVTEEAVSNNDETAE